MHFLLSWRGDTYNNSKMVFPRVIFSSLCQTLLGKVPSDRPIHHSHSPDQKNTRRAGWLTCSLSWNYVQREISCERETPRNKDEFGGWNGRARLNYTPSQVQVLFHLCSDLNSLNLIASFEPCAINSSSQDRGSKPACRTDGV